MPLPDRTLCWAEGPLWDRSCVPLEDMGTQDMIDAYQALKDRATSDLDAEVELNVAIQLLDGYALTRSLHALDNKQIGKVLAIMMSVLIDRGIDLVSFLPKLAGAISDDDELARNLRDLGKL